MGTTTTIVQPQPTQPAGPREHVTGAPDRTYLWVVVIGVLSVLITAVLGVVLFVRVRQRQTEREYHLYQPTTLNGHLVNRIVLYVKRYC